MAPLSFPIPSEPSEIKTRCCSFIVVIVKLHPAGNSWLPHFDMRTVLLYWMSHMRPSTCSNISSFLSLFHLMPRRIHAVAFDEVTGRKRERMDLRHQLLRIALARFERSQIALEKINFPFWKNNACKQEYFSQVLIIVTQCKSRVRNDCPWSDNSLYSRDERTFRSYCYEGFFVLKYNYRERNLFNAYREMKGISRNILLA